jgi:hypothetical protein
VNDVVLLKFFPRRVSVKKGPAKPAPASAAPAAAAAAPAR